MSPLTIDFSALLNVVAYQPFRDAAGSVTALTLNCHGPGRLLATLNHFQPGSVKRLRMCARAGTGLMKRRFSP